MNNTFKSSDGINNIYNRVWTIDGTVKGIIVVVHGLGDHIDNYDEFASFMKDDGYMIAGIDLIGFGKSSEPNKLGHFENRKETYTYFVKDLNTFIEQLKVQYPNIPIYLLGFSFGSFVARLYANTYDNISGLILIGSAYISPTFMTFAKFYASYLAVGKGWEDRNVRLYKKTILNLNANFQDKTLPSWLNSNTKYLKEHLSDPYISTRLTISGYYVLYDLIKRVNRNKYISNIRKDLPILILSGKDDPVTSFGDDVYMIDKIYKKNKLTNVKYKIYNNMRHDLLNEVYKDIVINDILKFLNENK